MSTLLDSLRRAKQVDPAAPLASGGGRKSEVILSALGYVPRQRWRRVPQLAVGGVSVALVTLLGWVMWEHSASMPPAMHVEADVSTADVGDLVEVPGATGNTGRDRGPVAGSDPVALLPRAPVADTTSQSPPSAPRPTDAVDTAPVGITIETRPRAVEKTVPDALAGGGAAPTSIEIEPRRDGSVPHLVDTGADPSSTAAVPTLDQSLAGATANPVDAVGTAQPRPVELPDPPPGPTIERGPLVTDVFATALRLQRAGEVAGAIAEYETLRIRGTLSPQVHNNLGLLYQEQNRLVDAEREFQSAIAIDPRYSKAYNNLGVVRMRQVRHQDAAAAFREARRLDGTNLDAWVNLALALQAAGDQAAARRTLVDALSVDARHAPTHYNLARSFELSGDRTRAVEHYGRFLEYSGAEHADRVELVRSRMAELNGRDCC